VGNICNFYVTTQSKQSPFGLKFANLVTLVDMEARTVVALVFFRGRGAMSQMQCFLLKLLVCVGAEDCILLLAMFWLSVTKYCDLQPKDTFHFCD
jgi:hypothetical protein